MYRLWFRLSFAVAVAFVSVWLSRVLASSQELAAAQSKSQKSSEKAATKELGGPNRYLTMVSTDKPIYHEGEKVYVRGVLLNASNHKPMAKNQTSNATIQVKGPKGDVITSASTNSQDSVWGFAWDIPSGQAGGEYTISVTYPWDGFAPAERKFDIRAYRAPRLKSQITFLRDGYGPGDRVTATLDVKRAEGGVPEGARVTVIARVDGMEVKGPTGKVDARGLCTVGFDLPREIPRGEGTLALVIEDGGVVETASKTIPILLQAVDLHMYPEGGDLVAGFKNRVYVQAFQPNGKPADLAGKIMYKHGTQPEVVASFHTEHEGRGRFEFVPEANKKYYLSITQPASVKTVYPLPAVKARGAVLHSDRDVFERGRPVTVSVGCTEKDFRVTVGKREVELVSREAHSNAAGQRAAMSFDLPADVDGVLTVTVWNKSGQPLAERLVFRQPAKPLNITVTADRKSYVPGENAKLTVRATDASGKPVSTVVGVTVTDDSVLEMVEKREQAPRLPVMYFLEPEVKDLADAHVYLDAKNPKAPLATDLLLGTQGWRRFALVHLDKFLKDDGDKARRALAMQEPHPPMELDGFAPMGAAFGGMAGAAHLAAGAPRGVKGMVFDGAALPVPHPAMAPMPHNAPARGVDLAALPPPGALPPPALPAHADMIMAAQKPAPIMNEKKKAMMKEEVAAAKVAGRLQAAPMFMRRQMVAGMPPPPQADLVIVREFAHKVRANRKPTDRVDFTETVYWNAGVKTDPKTGKAEIKFGLNDSVTTFRVFADGFADNGAIGSTSIGIESVQPFYAEAKVPLEVTAGDKVLLPISLVNATTNLLKSPAVAVDLKGDFKLLPMLKHGTELGAGQRVRYIQPLQIGINTAAKDLTLTAKAGAYEDKVVRKLSVKPKGFPIEVAFGGMIEPGKTAVHMITIPKNVVDGSMASQTAVYPTPLANLTEALQRLIQDPYGCFEQTSSTSYPLTMAQQYFMSHSGVDPKLVEQSKQKLDAGYKRLVGFWCPDKGYEWFGENPGHEALTAFGILHFTDMSKVRDVDQNMITTTRAWLMKQKDGKGGFTRKRRALHTWIEDKDCSNAYIVWALLESGQAASELKEELASLKSAADASKNMYVVALAANAFELAGDKGEAKKLMDRLVAKQKADGSVDGVTSSIVGSGGEALEIEGTSLATLAWLRDPAYAGSVEKSIKYLADSCQGGRYGSTQSTVLALRSIVTYDKQRARPKAPGKVRVYVDGQSIGDWADFNQHTQGAIKLPDLTELLTPGDHKLELKMEGGSAMPYSLAVKYNTLMPVSDKECKLDVSVHLAQSKVVEGAATEANVTVTNKDKEAVPMSVAIVGLPGGLEPRHDQLKELVKKGKIDAYEVVGREVVLYWRSLQGGAKVEVPLSLIAAVPGSYTGPASRAYLYYTDEHKKWVDGTHIDIAAK